MASSTPAGDAPIPFGSYLLDALIAQGGMARVYRARRRGLGGFEKTLVVKQVRPELARDPRFVQMFVEEAKTLVQLGHPHIVPIYELGVVDGIYFLAMEHVEGVTLADLLEDGPLDPAIVAHVGTQVADALEYAHARHGLVHRDVTPRNVLVDETGQVRLVDFGIAAPTEGATNAFGTPGYMGPEQLAGGPVGPPGDVFALGAVLYEALVGQAALPNEADACIKAFGAGWKPSADELGRADPELATVVTAALALAPEERPASAGEVAKRLRTILAKRRPEGVAAELGARVHQAQRSRVKRVSTESGGNSTTPFQTPAGGKVRTLATSPVLASMIDPAAHAVPEADGPRTVRIGESAPVAESRRFRRRAAFAVLAVALFAGVYATLAARQPAAPAETPGLPRPTKLPVAAVVDASIAAPIDAGAALPRDAGTLDAALPRAESGLLTVQATPWAEVRIDGRSVGTTPKRSIRLSAGAHVVGLRCPPLGRSADVRIRVEPGSAVRILANLEHDPPEIHVR